jgi:hypothetical protein
MKTHSLATTICFLALALPLAADTFILKDGTKLEGSVLREDATSYVVEVMVTKSIKDERVIAKADVVKVEREQADLTAFEAIKELAPAPDLLTSGDYAKRIAAVEKFLADHRGSSKTKEARTILDTLKTEANEVLAGGFKLNGKIIPALEYKANAYDIDARIQGVKIRAMLKESQTLSALRAFAEFDRDFHNTTAYGSLVPEILQVIKTYLAETNQSLATFDARTKERNVGLERMATADRSSTERAIREENAAIEARYKSEKEAKLGWVTPQPFFKPSLDDTAAFAKVEITRLSAVKSVPAVDAGKLYRDALSLINSGKGDSAAIISAMTTIKTAAVPQRYIATLEAAANAAKGGR